MISSQVFVVMSGGIVPKKTNKKNVRNLQELADVEMRKAMHACQVVKDSRHKVHHGDRSQEKQEKKKYMCGMPVSDAKTCFCLSVGRSLREVYLETLRP